LCQKLHSLECPAAIVLPYVTFPFLLPSHGNSHQRGEHGAVEQFFPGLFKVTTRVHGVDCFESWGGLCKILKQRDCSPGDGTNFPCFRILERCPWISKQYPEFSTPGTRGNIRKSQGDENRVAIRQVLVTAGRFFVDVREFPCNLGNF
jgi:hypothetical protein